MCGLAGVSLRPNETIPDGLLRAMGGSIQHRGPDGFGLYTGSHVGMVHVRLAIIDIDGGAQPMASPDGNLVLAYNGEVFNYIELRDELEGMGYRFRTASDTEVVLRAYEHWGRHMLTRLEGQFAIAIHDRRAGTIFLARDRFGIQPLFYSAVGRRLVFGSEIKAVLASGLVAAAPDPEGLDEVFTFWAAQPPRTPFLGVSALEPGHWAEWDGQGLTRGKYYSLDYPAARDGRAGSVEELDHLLRQSVQLRLRSDVQVGGYLSGGLDSSAVCAIARQENANPLHTFSIAFEDREFDESGFQRTVAGRLGSRHAVEVVPSAAIADALPKVIEHVETPLVRTGPVPIYLLSKMVKEHGFKVVFSGEGADEIFLGYDLFKEVAVRLFCLRDPASQMRPMLFKRLYPYLGDARRAGEFWARFFLDAGDPSDPLFSHMPRIRLTSAIKEFYSPEWRSTLAGSDPLARLRDSLPAGFAGWSPLNRAAYLEMVTLLSPYLLCSQSDRVNLANGVEGRYPFLDHRLFEFAAGLPDQQKLLGLKDKQILRTWCRGVLPEVADRPKQPYRAPDASAFQGVGAPAYVRELLSPGAIKAAGYFEPRIVDGLVRRCEAGRATGIRENQAFIAVLTTQIWHETFMRTPTTRPLAGPADVEIRAAAFGPASTRYFDSEAMASTSV